MKLSKTWLYFGKLPRFCFPRRRYAFLLALCVDHPASQRRHCGRRGCCEIRRAHILPRLRRLYHPIEFNTTPNSNRPGNLLRGNCLGSIWPRGRLFSVYGIVSQFARCYHATSIPCADSEKLHNPQNPRQAGRGSQIYEFAR